MHRRLLTRALIALAVPTLTVPAIASSATAAASYPDVPTIDAVATQYAGKLSVFKVDIDNAQDTAASFGISSVPTCIFFKNGKEVDRFLGNQDLRAVKERVDKVLK